MTKSLVKLSKEVEYLQGEVTRLLRALNEAEHAQAAERQAMKTLARRALVEIAQAERDAGLSDLSADLRAQIEQFAHA